LASLLFRDILKAKINNSMIDAQGKFGAMPTLSRNCENSVQRTVDGGRKFI
jgi:hypothetical protein